MAEKMGYETYTVDINPAMNPDLIADVATLTVGELPIEFRHPNIVWFSPPCQSYSLAGIRYHRVKIGDRFIPVSSFARKSDLIIQNGFKVISELNPEYYFIENPRATLRKMPFMHGIGNRHTVTYCQYGDNVMKPTDIWTNNYNWQPRKMCKNGDKCHESAPRGSKTGTQGKDGAMERGIIPPELCREILESCRSH